MDSVIQIIHIDQAKRRGSKTLEKDYVTIAYTSTNGYYLRFSADLTPEIREVKSANIARNTITGEVYLIMLKTEEGDTRIVEARNTPNDNKTFRIIRGKDFALKMAELLDLPKGLNSCRVKISGNIANTSDYYTIKFYPLTK